MTDKELGGKLMAGAGGIATSILTGAIGQQMQAQQNRRLMRQQIEAQKEMGLFNQKLALKHWNDTNAAAQVAHYKKAGLNVGLMYGSSGAGGSTFGGSGSVSGASAQAPVIDPMTLAQIANLDADTKVKHAERDEIEARTPTHTKSLEKTDAEIKEIASRLNINEETVKKIIQDVKQSEAETTKTIAETDKTIAETKRIRELTPLERKNLEEELKRRVTENVYLDAKERAELDNLVTEVTKKRAEIEAINAGVTQKDEDIDLKRFESELKAKYPSLFDVAGGVINQILSFLTQGRDTNYKHPNERRR